jgi:succinyl-diaminopimelate desuccinylase
MVEETWVRLASRIESYEEEMVQFQSELTACPALGPENGGQGEWDKVKIIEDWISRLSPDRVLRVEAPDDRVASGVRPTLVARFEGRGPGLVWILSHTDVVPPGELSLWDSDPFTLRRDGDLIYGRGVEDNQHGVVSSYFAVKALRDEGVTPALGVGLIFVADEETGSGLGLDYLLARRPDLFGPKDLIIVPDMGHPDGTMIEIAEKSMFWLKIKVTGRQCHASTPAKGVNTLRAAARMITALDQALPKAFPDQDPLYSPPGSTFEPTKKEANVPNVNTIPGEDVFYFDARVLPQYRLADVLAVAEKTAREVARKTGVNVHLEPVYMVQAPPATPVDAPVVQALTRAVSVVHGGLAKPCGVGGGTVAAFFRQHGLEAAVWSSLVENAHAPNEHTRLSLLKADAKVFTRIFMGL